MDFENQTHTKPYNTVFILSVLLLLLGVLLNASYSAYSLSTIKRYTTSSNVIQSKLIQSAFFDKIDNSPEVTESLILKDLINDLTIPIILTDYMDRPQLWKNISVGVPFFHTEIDDNDDSYETRLLLTEIAKGMGEQTLPLPVYTKNQQLIGKLYVGKSSEMALLEQFCFIQVLFILFFSTMVAIISWAFAHLKIAKVINDQ